MSDENQKTDLFALVLEVINPALVMGLVGSLAFFLLDVCYRGKFDDQLRWTLFFFVFAIVLVARISFTMGSDKAAVYGLVLAGVTFVATMRFVQGLGAAINLLIILVIAGSAYLLTKDTTWMGKPDRKPERGLADALAEPWQLISQLRSKRRLHGLWVVWFTLAALPLFGIGQSLIPVDDSDRRQTAFWRITIYVGCGLGLLLTTALVNLRQYLKSRKLKLPAPLAARWLATGAVMVVVAMGIAALLPRPHSETPLTAMTPWGAPDRDANRIARKSNNAGEGEGDPGGNGQTKDGSDSRSGDGQPDEKAKGKSNRGKKGAGGEKASEKGEGEGKGGDQGSNGGDKGDSSQPMPPSTPRVIDSILPFVQSVVRWLIILAVIVVIAMVLLRFIANSQAWAAAWWNRLMGMFARKSELEDLPSGDIPSRSPRPFAAYSNPFADNSAGQFDEAELIRYSFAALEAWAGENGHPRGEGETPIEFSRQVGEMDHDLELPASRLAASYSRLAYSRHAKPGHDREIAKAVWEALDVTFAAEKRGTKR